MGGSSWSDAAYKKIVSNIEYDRVKIRLCLLSTEQLVSRLEGSIEQIVFVNGRTPLQLVNEVLRVEFPTLHNEVTETEYHRIRLNYGNRFEAAPAVIETNTSLIKPVVREYGRTLDLEEE